MKLTLDPENGSPAVIIDIGDNLSVLADGFLNQAVVKIASDPEVAKAFKAQVTATVTELLANNSDAKKAFDAGVNALAQTLLNNPLYQKEYAKADDAKKTAMLQKIRAVATGKQTEILRTKTEAGLLGFKSDGTKDEMGIVVNHLTGIFEQVITVDTLDKVRKQAAEDAVKNYKPPEKSPITVSVADAVADVEPALEAAPGKADV